MSWTMAEPGQVKSDGTTSPTPLPERVGAKHSTCSGPSWRRYACPWRPSTTPAVECIARWRAGHHVAHHQSCRPRWDAVPERQNALINLQNIRTVLIGHDLTP